MNKKGYKNITCTLPILEVKAEESYRTVEGYFAGFGNIDNDNDRILEGAFSKSIQEHGPASASNRKIAPLAYHDTTRPIGVIQELREEPQGLYFRSKMGTHTEGNDFLKMYQEGLIREHSIGFNYIADKIRPTEDEQRGTIWDIYEVKLWEGSAVVFGSNSETPNLSIIKSQEDLNKELQKLNERMEVFTKALTDGKLSEKYNNLFTLELMQIQKEYNSLVNFEEPLKDTFKEEKAEIQEEEAQDQKEENKTNSKRKFLI
jgi:HK97 family phage prohead protease